MKHVPSPGTVYNLLRYTLTSRRSGQSRVSERLSSVDNIPKSYESTEGMMEVAKGAEIEMSDYERTEVEEDEGSSRAV